MYVDSIWCILVWRGFNGAGCVVADGCDFCWDSEILALVRWAMGGDENVPFAAIVVGGDEDDGGTGAG